MKGNAKGSHTEILLEDLHWKFRVLDEGLSAVRGKVDAAFDMVGEMKRDIEIMKMDTAFIKTEIKWTG